MLEYVKEFFRSLADDNIDARASSIAYSFMLSIFPLLIGIFALLQLLQQSTQVVFWVLDNFGELIPSQLHVFITNNFKNISYERTGPILISGFVAALAFGSYGFKTIFIHLSTILRDEKPRSFIWMSILAIVFSAGAMVVIAASFVLLMTSNNFLNYLSDKFTMGRVLPVLVNILRYPVVFISLVISSAIVYRIGPKNKMPFKCIMLSSFLFSAGWMIATFGFGVYLSHFARYNLIYGTLAGVVIFLVWMYLSAFIFLSAAEIGRIRMEMTRASSRKTPVRDAEELGHDSAGDTSEAEPAEDEEK